MANPLNVLHIITDSQRFDTIGALGNPIILTPAPICVKRPLRRLAYCEPKSARKKLR